jgi:microbial collagenase
MKYKKLFLLTSTIFAANLSMANTTATDFTNIKLSKNHKPSHLAATEKDIRDSDPMARDNNKSLYDTKINAKLNSKLSNSFTAKVKTSRVHAANSDCVTTASLASANITSRINLMKSETEYKCYEDNIWASPTVDMQSLFNESAMISIANEASALAVSYDGSTNNNLRYFITYLRAGKYLQENNSATVGTHGASLETAIASLLDELAANTHYFNTDETHAFLAKEAMILMYTTSASNRYRYVDSVIGLLDRYTSTWGANAQNWFTKGLIYIYRAKDDANFINAVQENQNLVNAMDRFLDNNTALIGHTQEPQFNDVASELGRMLKYTGQTRIAAQSHIRSFLNSNSMTGTASKAWFKLIDQVNYFESSNCSYYNTCNYKSDLEATILPITHSCSVSLTIRAQALTNDQLSSICTTLGTQEAYFHQTLNTNFTPVDNDNNSTLELVIYNNTDQYKRFSYNIFGNSIDNGGLYLEGDPSVVGNQARFFAHEAAWLLPEFKVWNLEHEYVHYLDGRFNKKGSFQDFNSHDSVWWGEGIAEYIAKKNFDDDAIVEARKNTYKLSELLRTSYDHDQTRIYAWGYLAVRFMFERQSGHVDNILAKLRMGDFTGYDTILNNIGTSIDVEFASWLQTVQSTQVDPVDPVDPIGNVLTNGTSVTIESNGTEQPLYSFDIPANATNLVVQSSGGTGDVDLYVKAGSEATTTNYDHRPYKGGNNETVNVASPQAAKWYVMGNPYGNQTFGGVSLTASWTEDTGGGTNPGTNVCDTESDISRGNLDAGDAVCLSSGTIYLGFYVNSGQSNITISTTGGDGDANIYHSSAGWPSTSNFENNATTANTSEETITVTTPLSGWHYLLITSQGTGTQLVVDVN